MGKMYNIGKSIGSKIADLNKKKTKYAWQCFALSALIMMIPSILLLITKRFVGLEYFGTAAAIATIINIGYCAIKIVEINRDISINTSGNQGEMKTKIILYELPEDYTVFSNVRIIHNGHDNEMDHVVVAPHYIYIIETKNYKGCLQGNAKDQNLRHIKMDSMGNQHEEDVFNPIKQVQLHSRTLTSYLEQEIGTRLPVKPCVFFADSSVRLNLDGLMECETPCFTSKKELLEFLTESEIEILNHNLNYLPTEAVVESILKLRKNANIPKTTPAN